MKMTMVKSLHCTGYLVTGFGPHCDIRGFMSKEIFRSLSLSIQTLLISLAPSLFSDPVLAQILSQYFLLFSPDLFLCKNIYITFWLTVFRLLYPYPVPARMINCTFKGTVLRDIFRKCWRKCTDLGLNKGRGWFFNVSDASLIFSWNKTSSFR
jgi:hypothetical protein